MTTDYVLSLINIHYGEFNTHNTQLQWNVVGQTPDGDEHTNTHRRGC